MSDRHVIVSDPDGVGAAVLSAAPGSDTGQKALAVRVISQLGAGSGGGTTIGTVQQGARDVTAQAWLVDGSAVTQPVSGTFWQTTQPVSGPLTDAQLRASGVPVTGPLTDTQLRATAVPVSGTFWQATQPVSGTFWQATQPVSGPLTDTQLRASAVPVSGTFFQATQPISAASLPLPAGAATSANQSTVKAASTIAAATDTASVVQDSPQDPRAATLAVTATAAISTAVTLTLPAPAAGLFHYITRINIVKYAGAAVAGAAAPTVVTSTNLPGSVAWSTPTALAIGTQYETDVEPKSPIKSSAAATATTIVAPLTTSIIWRITVYYYTAP